MDKKITTVKVLTEIYNDFKLNASIKRTKIVLFISQVPYLNI